MATFAAGFSYHKVQILKDEPLGNGAYGMVYKALCDELLCAAKVLHPILVSAKEPRNIENFHQECQILSFAKHPNIIQYLGTHSDGPSSLVLLMELMDESLTSFLERSTCPLPFHTEVNLCHDILLALVYLHANYVIHRDLSSNNVLLSGNMRAKVTDFGMSKLIGSSVQVSKLTHAPGCPVYMSPEAMAEPPSYSSKLDIFSFGVLTIQILTGKFPEPGPPRQRQGSTKDGMPIEVLVPDAKRRKAHIDLIDPSHPLLRCVLVCLSYEEKDRPTAQVLCSQVAALKKSARYTDSVQKCSVPPKQGSASTGQVPVLPPSNPLLEEPPAPPLPPRVQKLKEEGNNFFRAGQHVDAELKYSAALSELEKAGKEHEPSIALLLSNRAACLLKNGNFPKCIEDCTRSLALSPVNIKTILRRAAAYDSLEKYGHAFNDYQLALKVDSSIELAAIVTARLGRLLADRYGDDWKAKLPDHPETDRAMAVLSMRRAQLAEAQENGPKASTPGGQPNMSGPNHVV